VSRVSVSLGDCGTLKGLLKFGADGMMINLDEVKKKDETVG